MKFLFLIIIFLSSFFLFSQEESQEVILAEPNDTLPKRHLADFEITFLGLGLNFAKPVSQKLSLGAGIGGPYYYGISLTPNYYQPWDETSLENRIVVNLFSGRLFLRHYTLKKLVLEGGFKYTYTMLSGSDFCKPCSDQMYGAEIAIIFGKRAVKLKSSFSFMISNYNTTFFIIWNPIILNINLN